MGRTDVGIIVKGIAIIFGLLIVAGAIGSVVGEPTEEREDSAAGASPTSRATAAVATATATATAEPTLAATPTPRPEPIVLSGSGNYATDPVELPYPANATFTHRGAANFIVYQHQGGREHLLVNTIGSYEGTRPLWAERQTLTKPSLFDITADGAWTITIEAIDCCAESGEFEGRGDAVSVGFLTDAPSGPWEIRHDGSENFIVYLHCTAGSTLVVNEIGPVEESAVVTLRGDFCIWEVRADGAWSLRPR